MTTRVTEASGSDATCGSTLRRVMPSTANPPQSGVGVGEPVKSVVRKVGRGWEAVVCHETVRPDHIPNGCVTGVDCDAGQVADSDGEIHRCPDLSLLEEEAEAAPAQPGDEAQGLETPLEATPAGPARAPANRERPEEQAAPCQQENCRKGSDRGAGEAEYPRHDRVAQGHGHGAGRERQAEGRA